MLSRLLIALSLTYLAIPYVVYFIGSLQPLWALIALLLVVTLLLSALRYHWRMPIIDKDTEEGVASPRPLTLLLYLLVCGFWVLIGGIGGYGYQTSDWIKHEALLKDLIELPWPVVYEYYTLPVAQVYYTALYLPVAALGKLLGWQAANAALYAWALIGVLLAALWFSFLLRKFNGWVLALFIFFAGLDWVGLLILSAPNWQPAIAERWLEVEDWVSLILQYDSMSNMLFWAPQHAIAGWLAGAMTFYLITRRVVRVTLVPLALTGLWSPFVAIGLLPLLLIDWITQPKPWRHLSNYLLGPNLAALALLALTAFYYSAKVGLISPMLEGSLPHGFLLSDPPIDLATRLGQLLLFMLMEFGLYALLLAPTLRTEPPMIRRMAVAVLVTLLVLPLYSVGLNNDLALRASIPALFLLAVLVGRALVNWQSNWRSKGQEAKGAPGWVPTGLLTLFLIGSLTPLSEIVRQLSPFFSSTLFNSTMTWQITQAEKGKGIEELFGEDTTRFTQYVGNINAPFFRLLAKPSQLSFVEPEPTYISYDNKILLDDHRLSPQVNVQPGSKVELLLTLHVFTDVIEQNYGLLIRLVGEGGEEIWKEQGWPQNRPTDQESEELIWPDVRQISIPTDATPGFYRLELAVVDTNTQTMLPATALPEDLPLGELVPIGYLIVGPPPITSTERWPQPIFLRDGVAMVGATIQPSEPVTAGETVSVTLRWQARTAIRRDYTSFVHLLGPDGTLVAQWDQPPRNGFLPTRIWSAGFGLDETYKLTLPPTAEPGTYTLVAGMYDATGQRLPVIFTRNAADNSLDTTFPVGTVQVK